VAGQGREESRGGGGMRRGVARWGWGGGTLGWPRRNQPGLV
jgi:hypothetical protein